MITYNFYVYIILVELGGSRDVSRFCQPNFLIGVQCWYFGQVSHTNSQSFDPHVLGFVPCVPVFHVCFGVRNAEQNVEQFLVGSSVVFFPMTGLAPSIYITCSRCSSQIVKSPFSLLLVWYLIFTEVTSFISFFPVDINKSHIYTHI